MQRLTRRVSVIRIRLRIAGANDESWNLLGQVWGACPPCPLLKSAYAAFSPFYQCYIYFTLVNVFSRVLQKRLYLLSLFLLLPSDNCLLTSKAWYNSTTISIGDRTEYGVWLSVRTQIYFSWTANPINFYAPYTTAVALSFSLAALRYVMYFRFCRWRYNCT